MLFAMMLFGAGVCALFLGALSHSVGTIAFGAIFLIAAVVLYFGFVPREPD